MNTDDGNIIVLDEELRTAFRSNRTKVLPWKESHFPLREADRIA